MIANAGGTSSLAGYVMFGGVFPHARVQQIAVTPMHRGNGVADALISQLVSRLEARSYLTITAAVASDLDKAQKFYRRNGFIPKSSKQGGAARGRTIILHVRDLETESFLSELEGTTETASDLGLRRRAANLAPLYAIDLNVLLDLVRKRERTELANRLFAAALSHQIRMAVAPEFLVELQRNTTAAQTDPLLNLALQLPRLPKLSGEDVSALADKTFTIAFPSGAKTDQSVSDSRHLAQAALARAAGYITSDKAMLDCRDRLLKEIGIDVVNLNEFAALLPPDNGAIGIAPIIGMGFEVGSITPESARLYFDAHSVAEEFVVRFLGQSGDRDNSRFCAVYEGGETVAVAMLCAARTVDGPMAAIVHVRPDHVLCELFADYLIEFVCRESCKIGPVLVDLANVPGQAAVRRAAAAKGFYAARRGDHFSKIAVGRPITANKWEGTAAQIRRKCGLSLPIVHPSSNALSVDLKRSDGADVKIRLSELENLIGPTIIVWGDRTGVIVPIEKDFADELLGTRQQLSFLNRREASLLSRRTYLNSPRTVSKMLPGTPILFYESVRSGGRKAIVAAAQIVDASILKKSNLPNDIARRIVVDDLSVLSATEEVLATTFGDVLEFPTPVRFDVLKKLGVAGNFITATAISYAHLTAILELGWSDG